MKKTIIPHSNIPLNSVIKVWGSIALWRRVRVSVQASVLSMQQTLNINSASPSPPTFSEDNSISVWKLLFCRNVDTNANGAIDFNEFIDMMVKRRDCLEDDVAHAFKADLWAMFDESFRISFSFGPSSNIAYRSGVRCSIATATASSARRSCGWRWPTSGSRWPRPRSAPWSPRPTWTGTARSTSRSSRGWWRPRTTPAPGPASPRGSRCYTTTCLVSWTFGHVSRVTWKLSKFWNMLRERWTPVLIL